MRTALLSDVHGNRHAFEAVLAAIDTLAEGKRVLTEGGDFAPVTALETHPFNGELVEIKPRGAPDIGWIARLGAAAADGYGPPKPLYLRAPDAQPQDAGQLPRR